ncbi:hypothetical protein [Nocardia sp. IFM 10818]
MTFDFDPLTPEESDGGLTPESGTKQFDLDSNAAEERSAIPKFGYLSDLSRHDVGLIDHFLAAQG